LEKEQLPGIGIYMAHKKDFNFEPELKALTSIRHKRLAPLISEEKHKKFAIA
jgi:hypothetical protein